MDWRSEGKDPDYRFSLANERTFLAWVRTALAILAGAIVLHQVGFEAYPHWVASALGVGLSLFSGAIGFVAYRRWRANEIAMRHSRSRPSAVLLPVLAAVGAVLGVAAVAMMLVP